MSEQVAPVLGFHATVRGNRRGLKERYFKPLDDAGLPFAICAVDDGGLVGEACAFTNAKHWIIFRSNHDLDGVWLDVPQHTDGASHYDESADSYWSRLKAKIETYPEVVANKDRIWIAALNELDDTQPDYLHPMLLELAQLVNADGYRVVLPNWATGNLPIDLMERDDHLALLRYCADNRDICAIGIHEYSLNNDLFHGYPYLVGRWQFYVDVCLAYGINEPQFIVKEFGYHAYQHMDPAHVIPQLRDLMWRDRPDIPRMYWDFANTDAQDLIQPIAQLVLTERFDAYEVPVDDGPDRPPWHDEGDEIGEALLKSALSAFPLLMKVAVAKGDVPLATEDYFEHDGTWYAVQRARRADRIVIYYTESDGSYSIDDAREYDPQQGKS